MYREIELRAGNIFIHLSTYVYCEKTKQNPTPQLTYSKVIYNSSSMLGFTITVI